MLFQLRAAFANSVLATLNFRHFGSGSTPRVSAGCPGRRRLGLRAIAAAGARLSCLVWMCAFHRASGNRDARGRTLQIVPRNCWHCRQLIVCVSRVCSDRGNLQQATWFDAMLRTLGWRGELVDATRSMLRSRGELFLEHFWTISGAAALNGQRAEGKKRSIVPKLARVCAVTDQAILNRT